MSVQVEPVLKAGDAVDVSPGPTIDEILRLMSSPSNSPEKPPESQHNGSNCAPFVKNQYINSLDYGNSAVVPFSSSSEFPVDQGKNTRWQSAGIFPIQLEYYAMHYVLPH